MKIPPRPEPVLRTQSVRRISGDKSDTAKSRFEQEVTERRERRQGRYDRRQRRQKVLLDLRSGRDRRRNGPNPSIDIEV